MYRSPPVSKHLTAASTDTQLVRRVVQRQTPRQFCHRTTPGRCLRYEGFCNATGIDTASVRTARSRQWPRSVPRCVPWAHVAMAVQRCYSGLTTEETFCREVIVRETE